MNKDWNKLMSIPILFFFSPGRQGVVCKEAWDLTCDPFFLTLAICFLCLLFYDLVRW